jgi:hypothetical protein
LNAGAQQEKTTEKPDQHHHDVNKRGDQVMGFSHEKTTHHFRLFEDGGAIEVTANDAKDTASRDQIRMHLGHIAGMFTAGNFEAPFLVHAMNPPGVATMKELREKIDYKFANTDRGGRVRITTRGSEALKAVHEFLRFQIDEHQTGDSPEISKEMK